MVDPVLGPWSPAARPARDLRPPPELDRLRTPPVATDLAGAGPGSAEDEDAARRVVLRRQVQVDWHAASRSYVHRIVDLHTGDQILQMPSAQVLDMVADVMRKIRDA